MELVFYVFGHEAAHGGVWRGSEDIRSGSKMSRQFLRQYFLPQVTATSTQLLFTQKTLALSRKTMQIALNQTIKEVKPT